MQSWVLLLSSGRWCEGRKGQNKEEEAESASGGGAGSGSKVDAGGRSPTPRATIEPSRRALGGVTPPAGAVGESLGADGVLAVLTDQVGDFGRDEDRVQRRASATDADLAQSVPCWTGSGGGAAASTDCCR